MSREERRQYERMMKNMERGGAALPPAARAKVERNAARRAARRAQSEERGLFATRFWVRTVLIAIALGFLGLSLQWDEGLPRAAYAGLIVGAIALVVLVGLRLLQRRAANRS
jgi:hypothetical protein